MQTTFDDADIEKIAQRVADILRPLLSLKQDVEDTIFTVEELAEYLRVSAKWVYDHKHELPHFKPGGLLRFRKKDIDREIDRLFLKERSKKNPAGKRQDLKSAVY